MVLQVRQPELHGAMQVQRVKPHHVLSLVSFQLHIVHAEHDARPVTATIDSRGFRRSLAQGFHKILKKHDKMLPHAPCQQFYVAHLHQQKWVQVRWWPTAWCLMILNVSL